jgi:hypothetical protein
VLVHEASRTLRVERRSSGEISVLQSVPLSASAAAPYPLQVFALDDKVRARIGESVVEADRGALREGRLSLVAEGGGRFGSLVVEGLDAYRFEFQTSRFKDFESHIGSFDAQLAEIPADVMGAGAVTTTVSALLASTASDITDVMKGDADQEVRQRLFDRWVLELGLPLRPEVTQLQLSRSSDSSGAAQLFLLESPEPLPFSIDITAGLKKRHILPPGCLGFFERLLTRSTDAVRTLIRPSVRPRPVPQVLRDFADGLHFANGRVAGVVPPGIFDAIVTAPHRLVRAVDTDGTRRLEVYDVHLRAGRGSNFTLDGTRVQDPDVMTSDLHLSVRAFETLEVGELGLADDRGRVIGPFVPVTEAIDLDVELVILTNGDETRALLIPVTVGGASAPQTAGRYRLQLDLDRQRFRTQTADPTTNYRAHALLAFDW